MAKRFGGRHSPQERDMHAARMARPTAGDARHPLDTRPKWITIAATPLLPLAFMGGEPLWLAKCLLAFATIALGMRLTRDGLRAEAAYDARRTARRPSIPRKLFGSLLAGVGLAVAAMDGLDGGAAVIGATGTILHWLAFGFDPMRDKGMTGVDSFQQDRAQRIVSEGEAHLAAMQDAILRTGDRRLEARVAIFAATTRELFGHIEEDPDHIAALRRYLGVYLQGARDATVKFADLHAQTRDPRARQDYETLLNDLEGEFAARSAKLLEGGRAELDIEISVLRERLAREGLRPAGPDRPMTADDLLIPRESGKRRP